MIQASLKHLLEGRAEELAPRLLGCLLERTIAGQKIIVRIVETEAYHQTDQASHSYRGMTPRTEVMFGAAGKLYVYFTYGMHYCCNIVTGKAGEGSAILIRAVEPVSGIDLLEKNRPDHSKTNITNGPAKLCQALAIDRTMNGHDLEMSPLKLILQPPLPANSIIVTTRVGISRAREKPWRFYIKNNAYVSKK